MLAATSILAHQGGWDEIAYVAAPVVALAAILLLANRRARQLERERDDDRDR